MKMVVKHGLLARNGGTWIQHDPTYKVPLRQKIGTSSRSTSAVAVCKGMLSA
jgi:hypothetical protein